MSVCIGGEACSRFFLREVLYGSLYGFSWPAALEDWSLRLSCVQFIATFLNNFRLIFTYHLFVEKELVKIKHFLSCHSKP